MSHNDFHGNDLPKPMDTLDLHGFTKSDAISRMTDFLERSNLSLKSENSWVIIVTGSGAHSPEGPVLRGAVEALLKKRKMEYHLLKGKGSFLVNASSGFVLYEPSQPTDSKVLVGPSSASTFTDTPNRTRRSALVRQLVENRGRSRKALKKQFHNVRNEEAAFDRAVSSSLKEKEKEKEEDKAHEELLERAVKLSLVERQKETEEDEKLSEAIELSKKESTVNAMDEDEQIRKLMALSKAEFDQQHDPDTYLQRVLELSRKESNNDYVGKNWEDKEYDEGMLKALEMSVVDF